MINKTAHMIWLYLEDLTSPKIMKRKIKLGDRVKIESSRHPDVISGTIGTVTDILEGGYGVLIEGSWLIAGGDRGQTTKGKQVVWYPAKDITKI